MTLVWKKPAFFLAHPKAIAAFGRECTRRGVPPPTVNLFGSPFLTWRGVPLIPTNKLQLEAKSKSGPDSTSILLLRVGEGEQGVVGLQKAGVTGEVEPGLSVRYMGTDQNSIASHLVTRYFSASVLTVDAIARLDNVLVGQYHEYNYKYRSSTFARPGDTGGGRSVRHPLDLAPSQRDLFGVAKACPGFGPSNCSAIWR